VGCSLCMVGGVLLGRVGVERLESALLSSFLLFL
jgi:hypothetical protein